MRVGGFGRCRMDLRQTGKGSVEKGNERRLMKCTWGESHLVSLLKLAWSLLCGSASRSPGDRAVATDRIRSALSSQSSRILRLFVSSV